MTYRNNDNKIRRLTIFTLFGIVGVFFCLNIVLSLYPNIFNNSFNIFAQTNITGRSATNMNRLLSETSSNRNSSDLKILDSLAMCDVIDPNLTPVVNKAYELESYTGKKKPTDSKVGVNADMNPQTGAADGKAVLEEFGMGFTLASIEGASDLDIAYAKDFINTFGSDTVIPIIRLCAGNVESCKFKTENSVNGEDPIVYFYKTLASQVENEFIAMVGPNEPGTGVSSESSTSADELEIEAFLGKGNRSFGALVERVMKVAGELQGVRAVNGGNVYLSPGAANLSNTTINDVKGLFESINDYSLFDYVMGNAYSKVSGLSAYQQYENTGDGSLKNIVEANENLQMIFTEFGVITDGSTGNSREDGVSDAVESMQKFCEDEKVGGVLFFRSIARNGLQTLDKHKLFDDEVNEIIGNCGTTSSRENAWLNCSLDATLNTDYTFSEQSIANSCGANVSSAATSPSLKVKCEAGSGCFVTRTVTQRISMPIRAFASNSPTGSLHYNYSPVANDVASLYSGNASIDPLNQFAGEIKLKNTNISYPMPWLGSALNNAGELLKGAPQGNITARNIEQNINPLSLMDESLKEYNVEIQGGDYVDGRPSLPVETPEDGQEKLNEERALCLSENGKIIGCVDKAVASNIETLFSPYVPFEREINYKNADGGQCSATNMVYRDEEFNYVTGPEVVVKQDQRSRIIGELDGTKICTQYAKRKIKIDIAGLSFPTINREVDQEISCSILPKTIDIDAAGRSVRPPLACTRKEADGKDVPNFSCENASGTNLSTEQLIKNGRCDVPDSFQPCLVWNGQGAFFEGASYDENVELDNNLEIPGVYDALANQYIRTQQMLSARGLKLVVYEDIGWSVKNEMVIRDAGRNLPETLLTDNPNKMLDSKDQTISGVIPEGVTLFDNSKLMARSNAVGTSEVYFSWLGYLDIFQELNVAYANNGLASKEELIENPYLNEENYPREQIPPRLVNSEFFLKTGSASLVTSFPIYTCDELESLKYDPTVPEDQRFEIGTYQTCIAARNDIKYDDQNKLAAFLCSRGYDLGDDCRNYCGVDVENLSYDQKPNEAVIRKTGDVEGVYTTLDLSRFDIVATQPPGPGKSAVPIGQFAENNNLSVAINTNFYDTNTNGIIGLFGDESNILYNKPPNLLDYALVKFKDGVDSSKFNMDNANVQVSNGTLGIVNIINEFTDDKQKLIRENIDWAVTGFAYFGLENLPQAGTLNGATYSSLTKAPRTVIGWNAKNELVMAVFEDLNIDNLGSAASSTGLTHGIILDGGGSAQLYSKEGLEDVSGINQSFVKVDGTVYHPNRGDTAASPRVVPAYLGAVGRVTNAQIIRQNQNDSIDTTLNKATRGFACPMQIGSHACFQGPYGEYSHCGDNDVTLPLDLWPYKKSENGKKVIAPEDSEIIGFIDNSNAPSVRFPGKTRNQGQGIILQGKRTKIIYEMLHFAYDEKFRSLRIGQEFSAGEPLANLCNNGTEIEDFGEEPNKYPKESGKCAYSISNTHLHISARIAGIPINPYQLFGQVLGCNADAPPQDSKNGDTEINGNSVFAPYCNSSNGDAANTLNDNGVCKTTKPKPLSKTLLNELITGCVSGGCKDLQANANKGVENSSDYVDLENENGQSVIREDLICRNLDGGTDQGNDPVESTLQCNEFNCFAPATDTFNPDRFRDSVACAANTLSKDIAAGKNLGKILDEYGPFCDNETRGAKPDGSTTMAFAYNLLYNFYANNERPLGGDCDAKNSVRNQDIGLTCSDYESDTAKYNEAYNHYRSGLNGCISQDQLVWTSQNSSFGSFTGINKQVGADQNALRSGPLSDFAQALQDEGVEIYGYSLKNTPKEKIVEVLLEAYVKNVNPWILLGVWATESNFGQYKSECNFY